MAAFSFAKAAIIHGGAIRRGIYAPPCRDIPRSTNFSPVRFAGTWGLPNHEKQIQHREPLWPRRQRRGAGGGQDRFADAEVIFIQIWIPPQGQPMLLLEAR